MERCLKSALYIRISVACFVGTKFKTRRYLIDDKASLGWIE